ncbi:MAG: magnesium-translocating P-type ATPase [Bacillota bacterium]
MNDAASLLDRPGLTTGEARRRAREYGPNEFRLQVRPPLWRQLVRRFRNPLVLVLIAASVVSAFTGDVASFAIIVAMVVLSVVIDFVQEHRADRAAQALGRRVQLHASVWRDGVIVRIPVRQLVVGDVVVLAAGSLVPADGIVLEANHLHVNESLLTGEAFPVEKAAARDDVPNLFMGTSVVSGSATMRIARIGSSTEVGKIAGELAAEPPPTSFERGTRSFGLLIMRITVFLVLAVLLVNVALHRPLLESFLFAVALAVGLTPELLPMILTVTLARGALRLGEKHVIVKKLAAIEGLGCMEILCTDKTGTLTQAHIRLERSVDAQGAPHAHALELARLNSHFQSGIQSPLDEAILRTEKVDAVPWRKVDEMPFDFERRRVSVVLEAAGERVLIVKGAPEDIIALTDRYETAGGAIHAWDETSRAAAMRVFASLGEQGLRGLGVAYRKPDRGAPIEETQLVFAGFVAFVDPPKRGVQHALNALEQSGVSLKILTGDNEAVTRHLCAQVGLRVDGVLDGSQVSRMDDPALSARLDATTIFCRVNPMQKSRIVRLLKARGRVTGFLGDGINDAPALRAAHVGLSVNNAVDVAQEAADIILMRRDLGVVHEGVMEGRRTFVNIRKYILMATSSNFGNMFSMAAASLVLPFLPMLPTQILLNNLLYDISEIPIPLDGTDAEDVRRPQRWDMDLIRRFMWTLGPVSSLFDFLTFGVLLFVLRANEALFRTGWFVESLATQVLVIFVIRTRGSPFASRPAPALIATSCIVVAIACALPFTPLAGSLGFVAPPAAFFAVLAMLILAYLGLAEVVKRRFYRGI